MLTVGNPVGGQFKARKDLLHFFLQAAGSAEAVFSCQGGQGLLAVKDISCKGPGVRSFPGGSNPYDTITFTYNGEMQAELAETVTTYYIKGGRLSPDGRMTMMKNMRSKRKTAFTPLSLTWRKGMSSC